MADVRGRRIHACGLIFDVGHEVGYYAQQFGPIV